MIYGDDPLKLNNYNYSPSLVAIIQSGNLYVYAMNNPVTYVDENGKIAIPSIIINAGIGATISEGAQIVRNLKNGNEWSQGVVRALVAGGASGLVSTVQVAKLGTALSAVIMGGAGNTLSDIIKGNISLNNLNSAGSSFLVGAVAGGVGYGFGESLLSYADNLWGNLSRTAQKQAIKRLNYVDQSRVNIVLQKMKNGATENAYRQWVKDYGFDVVLAATVAGFGGEFLSELLD